MATQTAHVLLGHEPVLALDDYLAEGGGIGLAIALESKPSEVIDVVGRAGLRGRGGGGFPTATKWAAVRGAGHGEVHLVCNAAEGEPGTFKDRWLLRRNPYQVVEGIAIAAYATGAQEAHVAIKAAYAPERDALERAVGAMTRAGMLGAFEISIDLGPDEYLFGEEKALLEVLEGNLPLPRILPPYLQGLNATPGDPHPTAVNNVETLANVPHIMREGAEWYRGIGTERSPGTMVFTISGDVAREGVHELAMGTPLRVLIEDLGGGVAEGRSLKAVFPGASVGVLSAHALDVPMDFESLREAGSGLGSGGFIVYDDTACMVRVLLNLVRFLWIESCAQCPACKLGTGDMTAALERIERGEGTSADIAVAVERTATVTGGARCGLPAGAAALVAGAVATFGEEFRAHLGTTCEGRARPLPKFVDYDERAGRFSTDARYERKMPDRSYGQEGGSDGDL